jgi:phosphatidylserine/phosphatidylglycerophosphate/cardiolipin synthase-like enzyme
MRLRALALPLALALSSCEEQPAEPDVYFCAKDPGSCGQVVIDLVNGAGATIECAIYTFNEDEIADAMLKAVERGVQVWVVFDEGQKSSVSTMGAVIDRLEAGGVFVRGDGIASPGIMHHKFVVIDGATVASGSFNFTNNANWNSAENLMVFHSPDLAGQFSAEFRRVWEEGQ